MPHSLYKDRERTGFPLSFSGSEQLFSETTTKSLTIGDRA